MRKNLLAFAAILCCATAATVFTACGSNDDNENSSTDTKPSNVAIQVSFTETEDILKYCDVSIEYNDGTGAKTESLTNTTWTKALTAKLPASFSIKKTVTLKAGVDLSTDSTTFKYAEGFIINYRILNAAGDVVKNGAGTSSSKTSSAKAYKIAEGIKNGRLSRNLTYVFDADGKLTEM